MIRREELLMLREMVEGPGWAWLEAQMEERYMALLFQLEGHNPADGFGAARLQGKLQDLREVRAMPFQRIEELKRELQV